MGFLTAGEKDDTCCRKERPYSHLPLRDPRVFDDGVSGYITPQRSGPARVSRIGGPEAWLVWVLATTFVVWLFAIQTGYAVVSPEIQESARADPRADRAGGVDLHLGVRARAVLLRSPPRPVRQPAAAGDRGRHGHGRRVPLRRHHVASPPSRWRRPCSRSGASFGFVGAGYIGGKWFAGRPLRPHVRSRAGGRQPRLGGRGSPLILAALDSLNWQQLLLAFGTFGVILTLVFFAIVRDPIPRGQPAPAPARERVRGDLPRSRPLLREPERRARRDLRRRVLRHDARGRDALGSAHHGGARRVRRLRDAPDRARVAGPRGRRTARECRVRPLAEPQGARGRAGSRSRRSRSPWSSTSPTRATARR